MSVASRNPFALLGDDGDAPAVAAPAKKNDPTPSAARPQRDIPGSANSAAARGNSGGRGTGAPRGAGGRGGARAGGAGGATSTEEGRDSRELRSSERGRGGGRGGRGRGGRGGRGREFDRHSQTARVDSEKTIAQGWGGDDPIREREAEEKAAEDAAAEDKSGAATPANGDAAPKADGAEAGTTDAAAAATPAAPQEEVDNTKTYDQYLAEQAERKAKLSGGNAQGPRAADEWKDFVGQELKKSTEVEDSYFAATVKDSSRTQKARKEKQLVEIDAHFEAPGGDRGDRGGRGGRGGSGGRGGRGGGRGDHRGSRGGPGGGRGSGGRGGGREGRGGAGAGVNLDDNRAFPSLGA